MIWFKINQIIKSLKAKNNATAIFLNCVTFNDTGKISYEAIILGTITVDISLMCKKKYLLRSLEFWQTVGLVKFGTLAFKIFHLYAEAEKKNSS